jgi:hypothetical protein
MSSTVVTSEAVVFFGSKGIVKSMLYVDFEAILDGMVGMPEFAGKKMKLAYCVVNGQLRVLALVFFYLEFDADGLADSTWNIPLRHLVEHASAGPDMGAGPIRLACRSQCPVAWHQSQLWDPEMKPGGNDFVFVRDTLLERGRKLGLYLEEEADMPVLNSAPPVLQAVAPAAPAAKPTAANNDEERARLAKTLKELRLRAQTSESAHKEEIAQLRYAQQQKEEILNTQLEKVLMQFKALKSQNTALKEQADSLRAQVKSLEENLNEQMHQSHEHGSEIELLTEQYRVALEQRLEEERAHMAEQLHGKEMEVLKGEEKIADLQYQLNEAQHEQVKMANSGVEKLLEKLQNLGLSFIAFHPGAGHISVQASEITNYMQNPTAFAARKCLVTEDHYKAWLKHYENPVCQVAINGQPCGKRVIRVDIPNQFKPGVSDCNSNRCPHCRSDKAIENVLKFR